MVSTRAIAASHPVGGPARRGAARAEAAADHAGFSAALAAAAKTAGEPVAAAADDPPQRGPTHSLPGTAKLVIPGRREAPDPEATNTGFSKAGEGLCSWVPGSRATHAPQNDDACARLYGTHDSTSPAVGPARGRSQSLLGGTPADASQSAAAGGSAIGSGQAAAPTGPQNVRPALADHVAARAGMPVLPQAEAAARKSPPADANGAPSGSTERSPHSAPHTLHSAGAAAVAPLIVQAIAAIGLPEGTGGSPVADHPEATASAVADPTARSAPRRAVPAGDASDPGSPAAPASDQGAADDVAAAGQAPGGEGTAAPPAAPDGAGDAARLADGFATMSGSPAAAPPASTPAPVAAIGQKPSPSSGGSVSVSDRSPARPAEPALFGGPVADTANPSPSAAAGIAAQAKDAPDVPPSGLAEPLLGQMIGAAAGGHHDLALHLHPAELGAVDVRVVVSGRAVSAWFDSPQPQVQQAISQNIGQLQRDLATAGYDLNGAWVGGETWTPRERTAGPALPRPNRSMTDSRPAEPVRRAVPAATGSGVSVYV